MTVQRRVPLLFILMVSCFPPRGAGAETGRDDVKFYNLEKEYRQLKTIIFKPEKAHALELKYVIADMLSIYGSVYVNEKNNTFVLRAK